MTITIVIDKTPERNWDFKVDDVMPRRDGLRIWKILKKIQLNPIMVWRSWGLTMVLRNWGPTMMLRICGLTMVLRN